MKQWEGRQGAETAPVSRGITVPLSTTNNIKWLDGGNNEWVEGAGRKNEGGEEDRWNSE